MVDKFSHTQHWDNLNFFLPKANSEWLVKPFTKIQVITVLNKIIGSLTYKQ